MSLKFFEFNVWLDNIYYKVTVFDTLKDMRDVLRYISKINSRRVMAAAVALSKNGKKHGLVFLCKKHCDVGTIAHEAVHVAYRESQDEEIRAQIVDKVVTKILKEIQCKLK